MLRSVLILWVALTHTLLAYPYMAQYAATHRDTADKYHIYPTYGVHHYPTKNENCGSPGCIYGRGPGEPSDPIFPQWWSSNWTMYVTENVATNLPPWSSPPQGFKEGEYKVSYGYSLYDASYNSGEAAMIEIYEKHCLPIFPMHVNWSCAFMSLGETAYFIRFDDRPPGTPECCIFSPKNHPPARGFVEHLPYSPLDSSHLGNSLQAYRFQPDGILFGYAFHKNYTPDTHDPTLDHYRHPQSFYFGGISADFKPLVVSQNYKDFRAEQPAASVWEIHEQICKGTQELCCLYPDDCPPPAAPAPKATTCPELPIEVVRARVIEQLTLASQLENSLMVAYLYAAASLKMQPDEFFGSRQYYQYDMVRKWKQSLLQVAREEMGHLHYANALLVAVGGVPAFGIPEFPQYLTGLGDKEGDEIVVNLQTFDIKTITNFMRYESSNLFLKLNDTNRQEVINRVIDYTVWLHHEELGIPSDQRRTVMDDVVKKRKEAAFEKLDLPETVAQFYAEIRTLIKCFPQLIDENTQRIHYAKRMKTEVFSRKDEAQHVQDEIGDAVNSSINSYILMADDRRKLYSFVIPNVAAALEVIDVIVKEGEGGGILVNEQDLILWLNYQKNLELTSVIDVTSHLFQFIRILGEYQLEKTFDPSFTPSRNLVPNPQIPTSCPTSEKTSPSKKIPDSIPRLPVTPLPCPTFSLDTLGSSMVDIFNRMYQVLGIWLQQAYIHQGVEQDLLASESLMFWVYMSTIIRPTLELIGALPVGSAMPNAFATGAFQPTYRVGVQGGVLVLQEMIAHCNNDAEIVKAFGDFHSQIQAHQRQQLLQISEDLSRLQQYIPATAPAYVKAFNELLQNSRIFVDEIDARSCYGVGQSSMNAMHPMMTPTTPWTLDPNMRTCPLVPPPGEKTGPAAPPKTAVVYSSMYEERPECTQFGGSTSKRLVQLHFRGWFQVRMATDPDPPAEMSGVTGNCYKFANEPPLDRTVHWQPHPGLAPIRDLDTVPYNEFGVDITEILVREFEGNIPVSFSKIDNVKNLPIDSERTRLLNQRIRDCSLDLLPVGPHWPMFKSENQLIGIASEGLDPLQLSLKCMNLGVGVEQEIVTRSVTGPLLPEMTPGQRQFSGRYSQTLNLVNGKPNLEMQKSMGFKDPQLGWRYYRKRQRLLQRELQDTLPIDPTNADQLILIGRILDTWVATRRLLVEADDLALLAAKDLEQFNQSVLNHQNCDFPNNAPLERLQNHSTHAYQKMNQCRNNDPPCAALPAPPDFADLTELITLAQAVCSNPGQNPATYLAAAAALNKILEHYIPEHAQFVDIRLTRFTFDAGYQHSISGRLNDLHLTELFQSVGLSPEWEDRVPRPGPIECYPGVNSRWGMSYNLAFMDSDLMWSWAEGDLWIPAGVLPGEEEAKKKDNRKDEL